MKKSILILVSLACLALAGASAQAAVAYWDGNGATPGAGDTPNGTWDPVDPGPYFWTLDPTGSSPTNAWADGDSAVFSAGSDATNAYTVTITGFPTVSGVTFKDGIPLIVGGGMLITNAADWPIVCDTNATIDVSSTLVSTGTGGFKKTGAGTLTLGSANTLGLNTIAEGTVMITNQSALGDSLTGTVVSNGASLGTIGNAMAEPLVINGMGVTNNGALYSITGLGGNLNGWQGGVTLGSNSRINYYGTAGNWWALQGSAIKNDTGNAYDLYIGGTGNAIRLNADAILQLGDGALYKDGSVQLRVEAPSYGKECHWNGGSIFSRVSGGGWFLRAGSPSDPTHPTTTNFVGAGAALYRTDQGGANLQNEWVLASGASPVIQQSAAAPATISFSGSLSGPGGFKKNSDTSTLFLNATNTYSGATIVRGGTLTLGPNGSISNTALIELQAGTVFNVTSNASGFTLQTAQTMSGDGAVWGNVKADGTLAPGSAGGLVFNNDLTIAGNLSIGVDRSVPTNGAIAVLGTLNNAGSGTLTVVNTNAPLQVGDSFKIFGTALPNGLNLTVTGANAVWTNKLATDGTIAVLSVTATQVAASNLTIVASGPGSFTLGGVGGANLSYNIYAFTNVAEPLANWWLIGTANADGGGVISFVDSQATNSQRFYRFGQ